MIPPTPNDDMHRISLIVNGEPREAEVPSRLLLSDFLRHELRLFGTHVGCEHGVCGACTILLDGHAVRSCIVLAAQVDGAEVTTVEGLGDVTALSEIQQAFADNHALQCGFCTPGFVVSLHEFLRDCDRAPTSDEIRVAIGGNLCRCTGYQQIVKAVSDAYAAMQASAEDRSAA